MANESVLGDYRHIDLNAVECALREGINGSVIRRFTPDNGCVLEEEINVLLLDSEEGIEKFILFTDQLGIVNEILITFKLGAELLVFIAQVFKRSEIH